MEPALSSPQQAESGVLAIRLFHLCFDNVGFSASVRLMKLTRHIKESLNQSCAAAARRIQSRKPSPAFRSPEVEHTAGNA